MNAGEKNQKKLLDLKIGEYRLLEIFIGSLVLMVFAVFAFFVALTIKKAVKTSLENSTTAVTSVKIGTIVLPIDLETSGNSAAPPLRLSDFVDEELFSDPPHDNSIVSSLAYTGSPEDLEAPILSHQSGYYPGSDFPINLKMINPNDLSTWLMVSLNGRPFAKFEGRSLTIRPEDTVEAYIRGDTQRWNESKLVRRRYRAKSPTNSAPNDTPAAQVRFKH